jgi:hypothetical protein
MENVGIPPIQVNMYDPIRIFNYDCGENGLTAIAGTVKPP